VEAAGVLLTVHPKEAGVPHITIRQLGRMIAGVEEEAASRLNQKLQNLLGDPCNGYLHRVPIGYHIGGIQAGAVMGTQVTSAGLVSGEETIVYRRVTDSSGIDQCNMARVPSQSPQIRRWVVMLGGMMALSKQNLQRKVIWPCLMVIVTCRRQLTHHGK